MPGAFAERVAVITGASSGIGSALAKELSRQGCKLGLLARRKDRLEQLAADIKTAGGITAIAQADVGNREETLQAVQQLREQLGPIDLMIANAGVGTPTEIDPMNSADVAAMFRINVMGIVHAIEAVLPDMLQQGHGHLAAVSSVAGMKGLPGSGAYCATKSAVNTFMEALRIQLRRKNIAVTTICPGFVKSEMTDGNDFHMPWLLETDDAARRIVRALERKKKVFTFPWQMGLMMRLTAWLPDWALDQVVTRRSKKLPKRQLS
jgi:short-subunit dehydrogenase